MRVIKFSTRQNIPVGKSISDTNGNSADALHLLVSEKYIHMYIFIADILYSKK